jgi:hypothetical protein
MLRLGGDIGGYVFPQQIRILWEDIIKTYDQSNFWYHEIYRITDVFYYDQTFPAFFQSQQVGLI